MPPIETDDLWQLAVLWPTSGHDRHGDATHSSPVSIPVRWNTKRAESLDSQGNTIALDAVVIVEREVTAGSLMWLAPDPTYSAVEQWYGTGSSGTDDELMQVATYSETPDIANKEIRRELGMVKYRDAQ